MVGQIYYMDCFNKLNLQWSQGLRFKNFKNVSPSRLSPVMVNDMALRVCGNICGFQQFYKLIVSWNRGRIAVNWDNIWSVAIGYNYTANTLAEFNHGKVLSREVTAMK